MELLKLVLMTALILSLAMAGCTKKEEKAEPAKSSEGAIVKKETVVKVPDKIKGKWKGATLALKEKQGNKVQTYFVDIGSALNVPGSDLTIKLLNFFPHFVMEGINLTSKSNETKNPAVEIRIYQGDKELYHGWVFANYPTTNLPKELKYDLGLVGATPAGN